MSRWCTLVALIALIFALSSCSNSGNKSTQSDQVVNACTAIAGQPVGSETHASSPNGGKLSHPPRACAQAADLAGSGGCYPRGRRVGDWFYFTLQNETAVGRPGSHWIVHSGQFNRTSDLRKIHC